MSFAIEIEGLSKEFVRKSRKSMALDSVSLQIADGEIFGIIGASGAGKSTLLKCMSTLEPHFSGKVKVQGKDLKSLTKESMRDLRKEIGMIFQHFLLLESKTVLENILLPLEFSKASELEKEEKGNELLALTGLTLKKDAYPASLSGGEKQRVAIARALATSPQILFCDEATSALDPKTTQEILDLLKKLNQMKGLTVILITHEMDVVRKICHKVAVIDQGKIIEEGPVLEIFTSPKSHLTKSLVQTTSHELNLTHLEGLDSNSLLLTLHFKGDSAQKPILSQLISTLHLEVNILSGWIDMIGGTCLGSLTITLKGTPLQQEEAFKFFETNHVTYEVLS